MLKPNAVLKDRYQIVRPLGQGGMGAVYLATHLALKRSVAIKQSLADNPIAGQQFQAEARILAHLAHPNLPRVLDSFVESDNSFYLVMEFVEGKNLSQIVEERGPLTEDAIFPWMKQVFGAVKYAHSNGIVHRDIKPQNIIITPRNRAVLVDFGIAKSAALSGATAATLSGSQVAGTLGYAPPEQFGGIPDERSDVYGLGATLYFAATGRIPEDAPSRAVGALLTPPREISPAVSTDTESVILTAMNMNSGQRYATVGAMQEALFKEQQTVALRQPSQPFLSRQMISAAAGLIALLLIALVVVLNPMNLFNASRANSGTETRVAVAQSPAAIQSLATSTYTPLPLPTSTLPPSPTALPTATSTSTPLPTPIPTPTPTPYPTPVLADPANGVTFKCGTTLLLRWQWQGTLKPDEHFDISYWQEDGQTSSVAWTETPSYELKCAARGQGGQSGPAYHPLRDIKGKVFWSVTVVRDKDGKFDARLSPPSEARWFVSQ